MPSFPDIYGLGRALPLVKVGEFSPTTTCYPEPNGRDRPGADINVTIRGFLSSILMLV
jgi:hypothetical protein